MKCTCKLSPENQVIGLPNHLEPRFLSGLPGADLSDILSTAKHQQFRASTVVVIEGDPAERLFLLTSGRGRHFFVAGDGRKVALPWLTAGQIFGGAAMISTPVNYLVSTEVLTESCVLVWERQAIRDLVSRYPKLSDNALSVAVTEHLAWWIAAHASLASDDAQGRIAHLLISLASGIGKVTPAGVEIKITKEDVAEGANVTPFMVIHSLSEWERAGVLKKHNGMILLRKPELLRATDKIAREGLTRVG
jgi:CRP-like cAMP-binding protein